MKKIIVAVIIILFAACVFKYSTSSSVEVKIGNKDSTKKEPK